MSKISLAPDASGTGIFTIASPNSNTNRTLTLPDDTGTIVTNSGNQAGSFTTLNTSGAVVFNDAGADVDFRVEGDTDANLLFVDAGNDWVGIGTNAPGQKLDVNTTAGEAIAASSDRSTNGQYIGGLMHSAKNSSAAYVNYAAVYGNITSNTASSESGALTLWTRNSGTIAERMRIDSSGNVGIGTSSPVSQLHVYPSTANVFTEGLRVNRQGQTGQYAIFNYSAGIGRFVAVDSLFNAPALGFFTSSDGSTQTERMRITSGGGMSLISTIDGLHVGSTQVGGTSFYLFRGAESATAGTAFSGTDRFIVFTNGNVVNTNNSYGPISDVKLKQDIVDAGSQWDDLKAVRIRKFRFKNDPTGPLQIGVIAQELEEVSPGLVSEHPDFEDVDVPVLDDDGNPVLDEEGNPTTRQERQATGETTKSVKATVLYMKAVKALQEAMERIETLEAKVAALETGA